MYLYININILKSDTLQGNTLYDLKCSMTCWHMLIFYFKVQFVACLIITDMYLYLDAFALLSLAN